MANLEEETAAARHVFQRNNPEVGLVRPDNRYDSAQMRQLSQVVDWTCPENCFPLISTNADFEHAPHRLFDPL